MWLRDLLNERRWGRGDLDRIEVLVRHRGGEGDARVVRGVDVREIGPNGLLVAPDAGLGEEPTDGAVFLPWARVLRVIGPEGVLWLRREDEP